MTITTISFTLGIQINKGDFNLLKAEASAEARVNEGESPEDAFKQIKELVKKQIKGEITK